jgi:hypothetical protein
MATLAASGSETTDSGSIDSGGAATTQKEKDADFELPSVFVERQIDLGGLNVALGLDFVPLTENVATLGGGTGTDAKVKAGNLITAYIQPSFSVSDSVSIYGKIGYASGDLEINDITRQAGSATQTGDNQSTDTSADKTLEGPVFGLGIQMNKDIGMFSFVRLEATQTDFDTVKHTNSNGKVLTAEAELDLITLTIGRNF